jgi:hypothetical protein
MRSRGVTEGDRNTEADCGKARTERGIESGRSEVAEVAVPGPGRGGRFSVGRERLIRSGYPKSYHAKKMLQIFVFY